MFCLGDFPGPAASAQGRDRILHHLPDRQRRAGPQRRHRPDAGRPGPPQHPGPRHGAGLLRAEHLRHRALRPGRGSHPGRPPGVLRQGRPAECQPLHRGIRHRGEGPGPDRCQERPGHRRAHRQEHPDLRPVQQPALCDRDRGYRSVQGRRGPGRRCQRGGQRLFRRLAGSQPRRFRFRGLYGQSRPGLPLSGTLPGRIPGRGLQQDPVLEFIRAV